MSNFLISVHDLMHKPGQMRELETEINLSESLGVALAKVQKGELIKLDLRLESVHEGIYVSGGLKTKAEAECSRCLDPVSVPIQVDIQELFAYSLEVEDDFVIQGEQIDLEQVIVDSVVLNLPFTPICDANCLGLCPECGAKLNENPDHIHEAPIDSRWSELKKLVEERED
jgi:uncharacterized protein